MNHEIEITKATGIAIRIRLITDTENFNTNHVIFTLNWYDVETLNTQRLVRTSDISWPHFFFDK